jgi:hypothetical protein
MTRPDTLKERKNPMKRYGVLLAAIAALWSSGSAQAATLCVGPQAGCFAQIQSAVTAATDGDTIAVAGGTYAGGITIDKSIRLHGAGAHQTVITGGGPVLTIGRATDPTAQTVSIDGVTVTGGVNDSQPDNAVTFGGGIWIPTSQLDQPPFNGLGATVSISNSIITGNTVVSNDVIPPGFCGPRACAFNDGGGIDNGGALTLTNVQITNNTAGSTAAMPSPASDAGSGGIDNHFASTLVMHNCVVSGNRVVADSPIANSASAGGIGSSGLLDIEDSVISNNTVAYTGSLDFDDQSGLAGGLVVDQADFFPHAPATVRNTRISGNHVSAVNSNPNSTPSGFAGGVASFASATFDHVAVADNSVDVKAAGYAGGDGGGMEVDSPVTMRDSLVARNSLAVQAPLGAIAFGGGITMFGADLTLERTLVIANSVSATSAPGPMPFGGVASALGGGISNGAPGIPAATLTLTDSVVNANRLSGSAGLPLQGGGVYTTNGLVRTRTVIAGNKPDDCFGC